MSNVMLTIEIYRHNGTWCFTDEVRGLTHEPFVLGIPEIIDTVLKSQRGGPLHTSYRVLFSANPFPKAYGHLEIQNKEHGGAWYALRSAENELETEDVAQIGWLCPATLKFFDAFPERIYVKTENLN